MYKHILLSSCTTLPLCITLHSIPSCENVITPFCENVITGSNLNRNKDPHESSTSPRSNKTGHKQTDYFLFCCDPLHVIFQLTWKNESKVAVVTWSAGNIWAILKHIVVKSKQMQWVRIFICSGKQFEDAFENQTNSTRVAMHIHGKAIWKSI